MDITINRHQLIAMRDRLQNAINQQGNIDDDLQDLIKDLGKGEYQYLIDSVKQSIHDIDKFLGYAE